LEMVRKILLRFKETCFWKELKVSVGSDTD
jgi:hypothetical protein